MESAVATFLNRESRTRRSSLLPFLFLVVAAALFAPAISSPATEQFHFGSSRARRGGGQLETIAQLGIEGEIFFLGFSLSNEKTRLFEARRRRCVRYSVICSVREKDSSSPVGQPPPPLSLLFPSRNLEEFLEKYPFKLDRSLSLFLHFCIVSAPLPSRISRRTRCVSFSIILVVSPPFAYLSSPFSLPPASLYARSTTVNYVFAGERTRHGNRVHGGAAQELEVVASRCARAPALIAPSHQPPPTWNATTYPTNALSFSSPSHFYPRRALAIHSRCSLLTTPCFSPLFTEEDVIG